MQTLRGEFESKGALVTRGSRHGEAHQGTRESEMEGLNVGISQGDKEQRGQGQSEKVER